MQQLFTRGIPGRHTQFKKTKIGEIPEEWELSHVRDILSDDIYNGVSPLSRPEPPGRPILNVSCIAKGYCDPTRVTYVDLDTADSELLAKKGDFYVLRGNGNRDFIGTGGVLRAEPPEGCLFSDLLIKIPVDTDAVAPGFIPLLWQSTDFIRRLQSKAVSGSGLWKIGLREIRRHEFARPQKDEQTEIVRLLEACDAAIAATQSEMDATERLKAALIQQLLTGRVRVKA
jgi:type I restriction enzyme S subunit